MQLPFILKEEEVPSRVIALLDMDCFECHVYQRDKPKTKGKPCVAANRLGRIVSVNYSARKFNISRSDRVPDARKRCPKLQVLEIPERFGKPDNSKVRHASEEVLDTLADYRKTNGQNTVLEFSPHDEYYLDLTEEVKKISTLQTIYYLIKILASDPPYFVPAMVALVYLLHDKIQAKQTSMMQLYSIILLLLFAVVERLWRKWKVEVPLLYGKYIMRGVCNDVKNKTKLTASAGVSTNKFRAKLASSENKPNGVYAIFPEKFDSFIVKKNIDEVPGLKSELGKKIHLEFNIKTMRQLKRISTKKLLSKLEVNEVEKIGNILRGQCDDPVVEKRYSKAINCGKTFPGPTIKNEVSILSLLLKAKFKKSLVLTLSRIWKWIWSLLCITPVWIWSSLKAKTRSRINPGGKVEKVLKDLSKEIIERLTEEKARNGRETRKLRVKISYFVDPSDPASPEKTEFRTFTFKEASGWNGVFETAFECLKRTRYDEKANWVTEIGLSARSWES